MERKKNSHKPNTAIYHYGLFPSSVFPYVYFYKNVKDCSINISSACYVVIINIIVSDLNVFYKLYLLRFV